MNWNTVQATNTKTDDDTQTRNWIISVLDSSNDFLKKLASENFHHLIVRRWIDYFTLFVSCLFISIVVYFGFLNLSVDMLSTRELANNLFDPSMTLVGILIAVVPLVNFSLSDQIAKKEHELQETDWTDVLQYIGNENAGKTRTYSKCLKVASHNFRSGILKFIPTYIIAAVASLIAIILLFIGVNAVVFVIVDITILISLFLGIIPSLVLFYTLNESWNVNEQLNPETLINKKPDWN